MSLLDQLNRNSEWLHLKVCHGDLWAEHFDEFRELIMSGEITLIRIRGETVVEIKQKFSDAEIESQIKKLLGRYSKGCRGKIEQAFQVFHQIRKRGRISPKALLGILKTWNKFSCAAVEGGVETYIEISQKEKHGEAYCTGIIKNLNKKGIKPLEKEKLVSRMFEARGGAEMTMRDAKILLTTIRDEVDE